MLNFHKNVIMTILVVPECKLYTAIMKFLIYVTFANNQSIIYVKLKTFLEKKRNLVKDQDLEQR